MGIKRALKTTDEIYSKLVRMKNANWKGYVKCITCGKELMWNEGMDAGHYVSRTFHNTRYYDKNVHPQCASCNRFHEGKKDDYALWLLKKYGDGILEELNKLKNSQKKYTEQELKEMRKQFREQINQINI
jgi:hypothetical protein